MELRIGLFILKANSYFIEEDKNALNFFLSWTSGEANTINKSWSELWVRWGRPARGGKSKWERRNNWVWWHSDWGRPLPTFTGIFWILYRIWRTDPNFWARHQESERVGNYQKSESTLLLEKGAYFRSGKGRDNCELKIPACTKEPEGI